MSTTPVYTSPFTGTVVTPTDVSYFSLPFSTSQNLYWPSTVNGSEPPAARIIDCVAATTGLTITLPQADQGTLGADILIRNLGAHSFIVTDFIGGQSVTVPVGIAIYFYLTNNTSVAGVWSNVTFGAGTSIADAATLAGAGLATVAGKLATTQNVINVTTAPTINDASRAKTYVWESGTGTFTLPLIQDLSTGWYIGFRNNGTGTLTIAPTSPNTIDTHQSINVNPGDSGFIFLDTNSVSPGFITVGFSLPNTITFTAATYDVDAIPGTTFSLVSSAPIIQTYIAQSGSRTQNLAVTLPAITNLYVFHNNTNQPGYNITFQNQGSSQTPFVLPYDDIVTMLSDGQNLYLLSETSPKTFYATNGSPGLPSFSFLNDIHTGMYLDSSGILGLSANSTEIIRIDNHNPLAPLVTVNAELRPQLISGGIFP
jgi:hypothetical protein